MDDAQGLDGMIAFAHIAGSLVAFLASSLVWAVVYTRLRERSARKRLDEIAVSLGVTTAELESKAMEPRLVEHLAHRFSSELLRNRLSDAVGVILVGWGWLGLLTEVGAFVAVVWTTFSQDRSYAAFAWSILGIAFFFWCVAAFGSVSCWVITGRHPGEARAGRMALSGRPGSASEKHVGYA